MSYAATFKIGHHDPPLSRATVLEMQAREEIDAACTAVIAIMQTYAPDGSGNQAVISGDGRTGEELPVVDLWHAWCLWAQVLAADPNLQGPAEAICLEVWKAFNALLAKGDDGGQG